MLSKITLSVLSSLFFSNAFAQVKFVAEASNLNIGKDDIVQVKFKAENALNFDEIETPKFSNFVVLSAPSQETGMTSINGITTKYIAVVYLLKPKTVGTFKISPINATITGKKYTSNQLAIKVTSASTQNNAQQFNPFEQPLETEKLFKDYIIKSNEKVDDKINKNMFVNLDVSKKTCYVGEPVVATYKLYTRLKSESNISKNPTFNGFSVVDMEDNAMSNYSTEKLNGRDYNVYTIRKVQLYPLQAGEFDVDEIEIDNDVYFIKDAYLKAQKENVFNNFGLDAVPEEYLEKSKITLKSKLTTIKILPLPTAINSKYNNGAVGSFNINATIDKLTFTTDENARLKVRLIGEGNFPLITDVNLQVPKNFEAFELSKSDNLNKQTVPINGEKTFEYRIIADTTGSFTLDSICFSFFDLKEKKYKTVFAKPIVLTITKGTGVKQNINTIEHYDNKNWVAALFTDRFFVIGLIALLLLLGIYIYFKLENKNRNIKKPAVVIPEDRPQEIIEKNWLEDSRQNIENENEFYNILYKELYIFFENKINIDTTLLNKESVLKWFATNNYDVEVLSKTNFLLSSLSDSLYNPLLEKADKEKLLQIAEEIVAI